MRNNVDLRVLGWGVKWEGLSQKLGAALAAVEALPPDCVVMFTDAYDVSAHRATYTLDRCSSLKMWPRCVESSTCSEYRSFFRPSVGAGLK